MLGSTLALLADEEALPLLVGEDEDCCLTCLGGLSGAEGDAVRDASRDSACAATIGEPPVADLPTALGVEEADEAEFMADGKIESRRLPRRLTGFDPALGVFELLPLFSPGAFISFLGMWLRHIVAEMTLPSSLSRESTAPDPTSP